MTKIKLITYFSPHIALVCVCVSGENTYDLSLCKCLVGTTVLVTIAALLCIRPRPAADLDEEKAPKLEGRAARAREAGSGLLIRNHRSWERMAWHVDPFAKAPGRHLSKEGVQRTGERANRCASCVHSRNALVWTTVMWLLRKKHKGDGSDPESEEAAPVQSGTGAARGLELAGAWLSGPFWFSSPPVCHWGPWAPPQ